MFRLRLIIIALILLFSQHCVFAQTKKTKEKKDFFDKFSFSGWIALKYDSNVFNYSRDDIEQYEENSNTDRFNYVKSIDDWALWTDYRIDFKDKFMGHTLRLGIEVEPLFYYQNKIKDYQTYRFHLTRYLKKDQYLEFHYSYTPNFFLRNLFDRDTNQYVKGYFDRSTYIFGYKRPINASLDARVRYIYGKYDYNHLLNEYDSHSNALNLTFWHRIKNLLSTVYLEVARSDARGELENTPRVEFDPSYDRYEVGIKETVSVTEKFDIYAEYLFSYRQYTTSNTILEDPYHSSRQDKTQRIGFGADYELNKNTTLFIQYEFSIRDVNTATEDPSVINAAILGCDKSVVAFGMRYKF